MGFLSSLLSGTGFSFSLKRVLGFTGLRTKVSKKIGVPTTRGGLERKIGATIINSLLGTSTKKRKTKVR